jgi:NADP-reducing hydrogenase subunit HndB
MQSTSLSKGDNWNLRWIYVALAPLEIVVLKRERRINVAKLSIMDLHNIKKKSKTEFALKKGGYRAKVIVHLGTCGVASGASKIMTTLKDEIAGNRSDDIMVIPSGCAGTCDREPMVTIETPDHPPVKYINLNEEKMRELFKEHVMHGRPVEKYAMVCGGEATY